MKKGKKRHKNVISLKKIRKEYNFVNKTKKAMKREIKEVCCLINNFN